MMGPGKRYVRTIFTRSGNFTLGETHQISVADPSGPEEVLTAEKATGGGWYITVCGYGEVPKEEGIDE